MGQPNRAETPEPAVEISGLRKVYDHNDQPLVALEGIDLKVEQGDFFALLGPNGAGKSTTIGVISSLVKKTSGNVKIHGVDIDQNFPLAKQYIGIVPQEFNFNQFEKVQDIVVTQGGFYGLGRAQATERAEHYLQQLGLWDKRFEASRRLSGGMKRRLMIARALVHQPRLLILDEPTAGVDVELRRQMWDFLVELNETGTTIILTTHYLEEAEQLCRNMAIIDHGHIIEHGPIQALLSKLDTQAFVIDVDRLPTSLSALESEGLSAVALDGNRIQVEFCGQRPLNHTLRQIDQLGCQILNVNTKHNRLEELFVKLTAESQSESTL